MGSNLGNVATADTSRPEPRYLKHLKGMTLDELFATGDAVESLVQHPGWNRLMRFVHAEIAEIDRRLDGRDEPLSQAEYAMAHGRRSGLRALTEATEAILHRYHAKLEEQRHKHESDAESSQGA